ncbi:MAG TPA: chromosomal replication initiator protein DnaA [Cyclobacteriaceae bacterium]|nr:chromosomal replication initiator protein DnaA [Cyclobacteriaceae bacterium]HMV10243.1 chromosomal replication initiator protein DnaA [Cyclobacteriaceae bacterium]HMV89504.1 chromosomal replication initiator protein DnaA [Cyclobacteriaceae bacterium]HMW99723.1 chromosomal replication initiator protein DnaA [Cyclobacteriaceae bacterium]HMX50115.1 chromosomal replication initiator protein DnaA [Cyclobacteriaceae bacterium]
MEVDYGTVWTDCLEVIKGSVGEENFNTWFKPIVPLKVEGDVLTIQVPSQFFYEWLEDNYVPVLKKALTTVLGPSGRLEYSVIVDSGNTTNPPVAVHYPNGMGGKRQSNGVGDEYSPFQFKALNPLTVNSRLNPAYTFENFVEGDCNRLARSAGVAVAKKPGTTSFNPLMLYGGVGVGKTHLVQAIGNEIRNNMPNKIVLYVDQNDFTTQFLNALQNHKLQEFQNFYLQVDLLILDDVQFLAGREKTQEIFFHIFNQLHQSGKQIIMTSDCPPRDMKGFQERLLSRFKWGLTADLQEPDFETKLAIIHRKMQADGIDIPTEVAEYLAYSVDTNLRDMEGVLNSLIFHATLLKKNIDLELAKEVLKNIIKEIQSDVSVDFIQKTVSEYFKVDLESLKSKIKKREIVIPRQVAMYFCKRYTQLTLALIGENFGGRDHSTVIHALESVEDMMKTDSNFKLSVDELGKKLKLRMN